MYVCAADTIGSPGHLTLENIGGAPYTSVYVAGQLDPSTSCLTGGGKRKKITAVCRPQPK